MKPAYFAGGLKRRWPLRSPASPITQSTDTDNHKKFQGSLIGRQWPTALTIALSSYLILQVSVSSQNSICNIQDSRPFPIWTHYVAVAVAACFCLSFLHHASVACFLATSTESDMSHPKGVYLAAACLSFIAGSSTIISLASNFGPLCLDSLGIETFRSQWPEWLAAAPLLGYIAIAVEDKPSLTAEDYLIIALMFLCIFFGFAMNFIAADDKNIGILLFVLSSLCVSGNIVMAVKSSKAWITLSSNRSKLISDWQMDRLYRKGRLAWLLVFVLPIFAVIYILGYFRVLNRCEGPNYY
jgi:hypothetical protein